MKSKMVIVSIGGGAGNIINSLTFATVPEWVQVLHLDSDERMEELAPEIKKMLIGSEQFEGQGSGGDHVVVEKAVLSCASTIVPLLTDAKIVLVLACLGRGTGSGGALAMAKILQEQKLLSFFMMILPFSFEGHTARNIAEQTVSHLRGNGAIVIPIMHDILYQQFPENRKANETFHMSDRFLADGVLGFIEILRCRRGLIPIDYASLKAVFKQKDVICTFGAGFAEGENKEEAAIANLMQSPLLGGSEYVQKADVVIVTLIGGSAMTSDSMKRCLEMLTAKLNPTAKTLIGANILPEKNDAIQLTMLMIQYSQSQTASLLAFKEDKSSNPNKTAIIKMKRRDPRHSDLQLMLPLEEPVLSLGIFSDGEPTIVNGQRLDPPTFQRLGLSLEQLAAPESVVSG